VNADSDTKDLRSSLLSFDLINSFNLFPSTGTIKNSVFEPFNISLVTVLRNPLSETKKPRRLKPNLFVNLF